MDSRDPAGEKKGMKTLKTRMSGAGFELLKNTINIDKLLKRFRDKTNWNKNNISYSYENYLK